MTAKQKHLDLKSRYVIEHSLDSSMSFKAIARELGKDCTTISKEIRNHLVFKKSGACLSIRDRSVGKVRAQENPC